MSTARRNFTSDMMPARSLGSVSNIGAGRGFDLGAIPFAAEPRPEDGRTERRLHPGGSCPAWRGGAWLAGVLLARFAIPRRQRARPAPAAACAPRWDGCARRAADKARERRAA